MKNFTLLYVGLTMLMAIACDKNTDVVTPARALSPRHSPHDIGPLGTAFSRGFGLNASGMVAGCTRNQNGTVVAFTISQQGTWFSDEEVAPDPLPVIRFSVNDRGDVAGHKKVPGGIVPVVWINAQAHELPNLPGYQYGEVFDINASGQMVGESLNGNYTAPVDYRATVFSIDGAAVDLGTLGGDIASAASINDRGDIVGFAETSVPGQTRAFLYTDGVMTDLGTLGGPWSNANSINNKGEIAGRSVLADGTSIRGFHWKDGVMTNIGTLGGNSSVAVEINDRGEIVGFSRISSGQFHAFLYKDGEMQDLGALLPGNDSRAMSINNSGDVTGYYTRPDGSVHAFLYRDGVMIQL